MRALLLLSIAALSIWLAVRVFSGGPDESLAAPASGRVGEDSDSAPASTPGAPGTAGSERASAPGSGVPAQHFAQPAPALAAVQRSAAAARSPGPGPGPVGSSTGELELAERLAHATPADCKELARKLGENDLTRERRAVLEAFAAALAGDLAAARPLYEALAKDDDVGPRELALVARALGRPVPSADVHGAADAAAVESALERSMRIAVAARDGLSHSASGRFELGVDALSEALAAELDAPWPPNRATLAGWSQALNRAQENYRFNPRAGWASIDTEVHSGDTLGAIAKRLRDAHPELAPSPGLLKLVNRCGDNIQPGQTLRLPADPMRLEADVSARWVLLFMGDEVVGAWEVAVGRPGSETITGAFTVGEMQRNPQWFPAGQAPVPFGDPANPLGTRWISWEKDGRSTGFGFHGTREPETVGTACSDGCMRMHNEDVERLYEITARGVPVTVRP